MKKLLFSVAIVAANFAFGQITLEHSFPAGNVRTYSNENEMFYVAYASNENTLSIYNSDYSLRKLVNIPLPSNYGEVWIGGNFFEGSYYSISKHIFNLDDKYEFMLSTYYFDNANQKAYKKLLLINEDGQLLKDFTPNAGTVNFNDNYFVFHDSTTNKNKLQVENYINEPYGYQFDIYSLPTSELTTKEINSLTKLSAFPIPTNKTLNIINPQNGANKVEVYDVSGKTVVSKSFNINENRISINVENLPKGTYVYKIGNVSSKFIKN
ncbi:T9SS type A sorting domain-containing protein [Epilithonimonas zeae]|uniref:T9SS type A sorting domain-containing protein n=1 Tax=Epilithonimonas zeae TaxID=1416779 RepID=UPI00200C8979|nr:T9SS type A sorting domain-containing protein [Epilithonimonas zeae]UQB67352.1 T9SS type A sorting domain-containing protein [Epilithonimonas zeae]